jgi:CubicO group peptidase (beta-lactamase class C family)
MKRLLFSTILFIGLNVILSCDSDLSNHNNSDDVEGILAINEQLQQVFDEQGLMGLAVVLIANNEIAYEGFFGKAVHEPVKELNRDSVFRIASITKTVVTIALMQQVEKGLIDLDQDVSEYLGWELRNPYRSDEVITLRHLLGHTSGIRDGEGYGNFVRDMFIDQLPIRALFVPEESHYTDDMFADQSPGEYFSYSNATWSLIASVIELTSNQRLDHYANQHIFEPLGLNASFNVTDFEPEEFATLYRMQDEVWTPQVDYYIEENPQERGYEGYKPGHNGLLYGPQGNLRIDTKSLTKLALTLMNGGEFDGVRILESNSIDEMIRPQWEYDGSNGDTWDDFWMSYGLGIHQITNRPGKDVIFPDRTMWGHAGIAYGLLSDMYVDPDTQSGVIFIINGSNREFQYAEESAFYSVEHDVFEVLYPFLLQIEDN